MRIGLISPCLFDPEYGGVQTTAQVAANALTTNQSGHTVRILWYGPKCKGGSHAANQVCARSKLGAAFRAWGLRGQADRWLFWHLDLLKLLPLIGARGARVYLFLHGIECWRPMGTATQRLLDRVDVFLSNSEFTWSKFVAMNPRYRAAAHRIVLLGVEAPDSNPQAPGESPVAVIIGRMRRSEDYKGHRQLLAAWPSVLQRIPQAELWVLGGGDAVEDLRATAERAGIAGHIRFQGVVSEEVKQQALRGSRCLLLPSRGEGFGLVYLEAMRLGRPCLAGAHDAGAEVVCPPQAGLAVDPDDIAALSDAAVRLLSPGAEWDRWSAGARRRYEQNLTSKHFERRLLEAVLEEGAA